MQPALGAATDLPRPAELPDGAPLGQGAELPARGSLGRQRGLSALLGEPQAQLPRRQALLVAEACLALEWATVG